MKFNSATKYLIALTFIIGMFTGITHVSSDPGITSSTKSFIGQESFIFEIQESSGSVYFWPTGVIQLETNGLLNLTYVGEYLEYGIWKQFFDIQFILANGTVDTQISNISQSSIGMNLIWGFGGFSPNFVCSTNWTDHDQQAINVANAPANATWPGLNGTLEIDSTNGLHQYYYVQNPSNGTQTTFLAYRESTGILQYFNSSYGGYHLAAELISPIFIPIDTIGYLQNHVLSFTILNSSGSVYFYPYGTITLESQGMINLTYTGEFLEYGQLEPFFDVSVILANGTIEAEILNVSQSAIGMTFIWGFGGFNPNLIPLYDWNSLDEAATTVANAPASELWPSLNGSLTISDNSDVHIYDFTQNPLNGTQSTYLVYNQTTGILEEFESSFGDYYLHAQFTSQIVEPADDDKTNPNELSISGFPFIFMIGGLTIGILCIITKKRK